MLPDQSERGKESSTERRTRQRRPTRKSKKVIIPILMISAFALLIARNEIPAVEDWFERTFHPEHWQVKNTCKRAALSAARRPEFARLIKPGEVNETQQGYYIEKVVLGEMSNNGTERLIAYNCYVDLHGQLVKIGRKPHSASVGQSATDAPTSVIENH